MKKLENTDTICVTFSKTIVIIIPFSKHDMINKNIHVLNKMYNGEYSTGRNIATSEFKGFKSSSFMIITLQ